MAAQQITFSVLLTPSTWLLDSKGARKEFRTRTGAENALTRYQRNARTIEGRVLVSSEVARLAG